MRGQIQSILLSLVSLRSGAILFAGSPLLFSLSLICTQAKATPPITQSGLNTTISDPVSIPEGTQYNITGGTRPDGGTNLFHSFGDFNIPTNNIANFLNTGSVDLAGNQLAADLPTSNILGRVTEGNVSNIFGTIQTTDFGNANLFLMNPAGFLFGPNATMNVGGMVSFTTANSLRLTDARFNAVPHAATDALLTAMPVVAFGFLGPDSASIVIQGSTLKVAEGQTLSLIGGNRTFEMATETPAGEFVPSGVTAPSGITVSGGTLVAPSGHIYIASVDSAGEVIASPSGQPADLNVSSFSKLGLVELSGGTLVDVSTLLDANFNPISDLGNGSVHIRGGQFVLEGATITAFNFGTLPGEPAAVDLAVRGDVTLRNSSIQSSTLDITGGTISVTAQTMKMEGSNLSSFGNGIAINGDIAVETAGSFSMDNGSLITSEALFGGDGGTVNISAGSVAVKGGTIRTTTLDFGSAGNLAVLVDTNLAVTEGGRIESTGSFGASGNVSVTAGNTVTILGTGVFDSPTSSVIESVNNFSGSSGTVDIQTGKFILTGNALVETGSVTQGGGSITIHANDSVLISNGSRVRMFVVDAPGGVVDISADNTITVDQASIRTRTGGVGDAGTIILNAGNITVENGQVTSDSAAQGRGGDVTITAAGQFTATGQFTDELGQTTPAGVFSQAFNIGNGGDITLTTGQSATLNNGSSISASSTGTGDAGNIQIDAGQQLDMQNSSVTTEAELASGGNIDIQAIDRIRLVNSSISTSVLGGAGSGGNITIDPNVVVLQNSQVIAQAVQGAGGNITITTPLFLADSTSLVDASSDFGLNGTVTIQSPTSNLSGSLGPLTSKPSQVQSLLTQRCAALANGQASSFVVAGREQLQADPGTWLTSPLAFAALGESLGAGHAVASAPAIMAMATQDTGTVSLRRLTPARFLVANFADGEATGCRS